MNFKIFSIVIMIVVVFACSGLAQKLVITEKQYQDADSAAWRYLDDHSYRFRQTREEAGNPAPTVTVLVYEIVPSGESRSIETEKTGDVATTTETIQTKKKVFKRKNGGKWTVEKLEPNRFTIIGTRVEDERVKEFSITPDVMLGDVKTDLYEHNETITYKSTALPGTNSFTQRFWLDKKGVRLKTEYIFKRADGGILERTTTVYEYDPKLRIEAPVIK